jgi:hypothetical protein
MKKLIYIFLFLFPVVALAQNNLHKLNATINDRGRIEPAVRTTSDSHSLMDFGQILKYQTPNQGSLLQIFDSVYHWHWDTVSAGWKIYYKENNMVYDAHHNLTSYIGQSWYGSKWVVSWQYLSTYDVNNNMTSLIAQDLNGSDWLNMFQFIYTYDLNNNMISEVDQNWVSNAWMNTLQYFYTYDTNNNRTSEVYKNWTGSTWLNQGQIIYTYNANNNLISELDQEWNGNSWVSFSQSNYTFDGSNKRTGGLSQGWNGSEWVNSDEYTYTYDANNNLTNELDRNWTGNTWVNYWQRIYTYDANHNKTSELDQNWIGSSWVNSARNFSAYDADNFLKSQSNKLWNMTGTMVTSGDSSDYYFHTVLGINDLKLQHTSITFYPNPATDKITIETAATLTNSQLSIMNLNGQELMTRQITSPKTQIDISNLPNGVYFVRLTNDKTMDVGKFVKQ